MKEITFEITRKLAELSASENGYSKQANIIKWNGGQPQIDIRMWKLLPDGEQKPLKGICISLDEAKILSDALLELKEINNT